MFQDLTELAPNHFYNKLQCTLLATAVKVNDFKGKFEGRTHSISSDSWYFKAIACGSSGIASSFFFPTTKRSGLHISLLAWQQMEKRSMTNLRWHVLVTPTSCLCRLPRSVWILNQYPHKGQGNYEPQNSADGSGCNLQGVHVSTQLMLFILCRPSSSWLQLNWHDTVKTCCSTCTTWMGETCYSFWRQ